jgi:hypothetical protein
MGDSTSTAPAAGTLGLEGPALALDWRRTVATPRTVLAIWAVWALANLAILPFSGTDLGGPDDIMRMLQVRDLLSGQNWFDVTQYRIAPPHGAAMHWSRLVDLPIAAFALSFGTVLPRAQAELAAAVVVPLLWLLPALFAVRAIVQRLSLPPLVLAIALVVLPLFPLLPSNFASMTVDHQTAQMVAAIVCAALLLHAPSRAAAVACGACAACWIVVSLEGLPLVALLAALYGLRYWRERDRSLAWFLAALTVLTTALSLATRPWSEFGGSHCDIVLPGHVGALAAATAIAGVLGFAPHQNRPAGRLIALGVIPMLCLPLAFAGLGPCLFHPMGTLDPLVAKYWYDDVVEGLPVWRQMPSIAAMLIWTGPLVVAGWWAGLRRGWIAEGRKLAWAILALFALGGWVYSLAVMREGLMAEMLAIPFAAALLADLLPRARAIRATVPRIAATLAVLVFVLPTGASALLKRADRMAVEAAVPATALAQVEGGAKCDFARLAAVPKGVVLTTVNAGPMILWQTPHSIVAAGSHRYQAAMLAMMRAFLADSASAEAIVRSTGATYVVACSSDKNLAMLRQTNPRNLANLLAEGRPPSWLAPMAGFDSGSLRAYRVR